MTAKVKEAARRVLKLAKHFSDDELSAIAQGLHLLESLPQIKIGLARAADSIDRYLPADPSEAVGLLKLAAQAQTQFLGLKEIQDALRGAAETLPSGPIELHRTDPAIFNHGNEGVDNVDN